METSPPQTVSAFAPPSAFIPSTSTLRASVGAVVIGRNEGERLRACLISLLDALSCMVYVDSGSTDGSVAMARSLGVKVVSLDMSQPFTAARARNVGFMQLQRTHPHLDMVQFVDGDCEVDKAWLGAAAKFLVSHPNVAVVCGRRRERFPENSVYNLMCDLEWDTPLGEARACGGDALMRLEALAEVCGYRENLIAGEEPELCLRLRFKGWRVWRLDVDMTLHDAAIMHFSQWWKRSMRAGFAYAEGAYLHGAPPERHWVREARSAALWGAVIPLLTSLLASLLNPSFLIALLIYPVQVIRLCVRSPQSGAIRIRFLRALFLVVGKFPEAQGQLQFWLRLWSGGAARLIEYK